MGDSTVGIRFGPRPHIFGPPGTVLAGLVVIAAPDGQPKQRWRVRDVERRSCSSGLPVDVGWLAEDP